MEEHSHGPTIKSALFIKNSTCNNVLYKILSDIYLLKKPFSTLVKCKETLYPFDDQSVLEGLLKSKSASLFVLASHSKKRPYSLILGRLYNNIILDMVELLINPGSVSSFTSTARWNVGARPLLLFQGVRWDSGDAEYLKLKSLLVDLWAGVDGEQSEVSLPGIQHGIAFSSDDISPGIALRVLTANSTLDECTLAFEFTIGRTYFANDDVQKKAFETHKPKAKKEKNVSHDPVLGDKFGTIHIPRQDFSTLQVRKVKALKKPTTK